MNWNLIIKFILLYLVGCVIIFLWQHRDSIKEDKTNSFDFNDDFDNQDVKNSFTDSFVSTSKNFLLVNQLFFQDNYFSFDKFLSFVSEVEEEVGFSEALQTLTILNLLISVSSSLSTDFYHQLFFSNRKVLDITEVKRKVSDNEYIGTVADFYEILISLIFHYKKFLIYK